MINFLRYRTITAITSTLFIAFFCVFALYKKQSRGEVFLYNIDFTGGTQILFKSAHKCEIAIVKKILFENGWENASVRTFGNNEIMVKVKVFEGSDSVGIAEKIRTVLSTGLVDNTIEVLQTDSVGSGVGADLRWKSIKAIFLALVAMLIYIAVRFWSFAFAAGAIAALIHDAFAMLAILLFFDREISITTIAALITILGYSINDTIVIFSQIRDYMSRMKGEKLADIVNMSLNTTLRRTMLTSISTGLPVLVMFFFGGEALLDFSLALLVGIVFGTYSSIYIASPIMMLLQPKNKIEKIS